MSTPNPLQAPGVLDSASAPKSRIRVTVLTILALHVVFIGGLLLQGCDKEGARTGLAGVSSNSPSTLPSLIDTNYYSSFPGDTQAAATAPHAAAPSNPPVQAPPLHDPGPAATVQDSLVAAPPAASHPLGNGTGTEHVIKKGDTLGDLAKKYGVPVQAILDANPNAKPRNLRIDDHIMIPAPVAGAATTTASLAGGTPAEGEVYVVKQGDNLSRIAKKFGVSIKDLRALNNIKGDRIVPKQRLVIPAKSPSPAAAPTNTAGQTF